MRLPIFAALLLLWPCVERSLAQTTLPYELILVEPDGGSSLAATSCSDVNDLGLVVGLTWLGGQFRHYEWTHAAGFHFPPDMPAGGSRRVNNRGDSVFHGGSSTYPATPDLVLADGAHVVIPDPLDTGSPGLLRDLNDDLTLIGQGVATSTSSTLYHWTPAGGSQVVAVHAGSELRRVNAHGLAVGNRLFNGTDTRAFVVDVHSGSWIDLHALLPGQGGSEGFDVNDAGQVLGFGPDGNSLAAWVWSAASGFVFLPGLAGGPTMYVHPRAIDNAGRVVGSALTAEGDFHAFLWEPGVGMTDLNALVDGGTFQLIEALDLSESGVIIGRGFHGAAWGPDRGFILRPVDSGPALLGQSGPSATSGSPRSRFVQHP